MKKDIAALAVTAALFAAAFSADKLGAPRQAVFFLYLAAFLVCGLGVFIAAVKGIARGNVFSEDTLMMTAAVGAFCIGEYPEAVFVVFFSRLGEMFEEYAARKSRRSVSEVMSIVPESATLIEDGEARVTDPDEVPVGSLIRIAVGERVPIDGIVESGSSFVDASALTGESVPRSVVPGDEILSGCINNEAVLTVRTTKAFEDSAVSKILELVETSAAKKSHSERFITRFAKYYTPAVMVLALLVAVVPPLIIGPSKEVFRDYVYRALSFLVVSCPCALVISVPLAFFGGIGGCAKQGILVKGGAYLEALAGTGAFVFDKTGTLTKGVFEVTEIRPANGFTEDEILRLAALAESASTHPIGSAVRAAYKDGPDISLVKDIREIAGMGIEAEADGVRVLAGNARLMNEKGVDLVPAEGGTVVYVAADGVFAGSLTISDEIKEGALTLADELRACGIKKTAMLTGDSRAAAEKTAGELKLDSVRSELLPGDKVAGLESIMSECGCAVAYVGDGINDAPVLARSDVGIAMGALGSDAAIEAADIVIMDDDPSKLVNALRTAVKTVKIARENIVFSIAVKMLILLLCGLSIAGMEWAVFADTGVMVLAVLNSFRALKGEKKQTSR